MRGGKSLLFRALAAREPERLRTRRFVAYQRRRQELPAINERHCTIARIAPLSSYFSVQRYSRALKAYALTRAWVQRDINRTRAVAHTSNEARFKHSVAITNAREWPGVKAREREEMDKGEEKGTTGTGMARSACWKLRRASSMTNEKFTRPLMHRIVITYHRPGLQESIRVRFTGRSARSVTRETVKRRGEQTRQAFVRQNS